MQVKFVIRPSVAVALCVILGGCSTGLLNSKSSVVPSNNVQVGNNLTLPPDLALPAPGTGPDVPAQASSQSYQAATAADDSSIYGDSSAAPGKLTRGQVASNNAAKAAEGDIYQQYGISRTKPDGTKKEEWELKAELKAAIVKRKRQQNPGYGTVFNVGNIFSDQ